ncbi:MAG: riboflavin kinase, partial [Candidatus Marinimicrobia bacterium]|nr:riboflavin kinase [Candidatus Neomarinimicrobiota bacterium]
RLTFNESDLMIEVHILNTLKEKLYGNEIEVQFLERLRDEIKFKSEKELIQQMYLDKQNCLSKVKEYKILNGG